MKETTNKIIVIGNYHKSNHDASRIVSGGIAPTVKENHGTVTAVLIEVKNEQTDNGRAS